MKKSFTFLFLLIFSVILAACGEGSAPSTTIDITMTDFQFTPNSFIVPAGEEITVSAVNNGAVIHNFVIMNLGTTAGDSWEDDDIPNIYWELEIQPGGDASATFTAPAEPGEYQVVCRTPGHILSGMIAKLTVVAGE